MDFILDLQQPFIVQKTPSLYGLVQYLIASLLCCPPLIKCATNKLQYGESPRIMLKKITQAIK